MSKFIRGFILSVMLAGASMHATVDTLSGQAKQLFDRATDCTAEGAA